MNKKASSMLIIIILVGLLIYSASTNILVLQGKQLKVASEDWCDLFGQDYDGIKGICINRQNVTQTNATQ